MKSLWKQSLLATALAGAVMMSSTALADNAAAQTSANTQAKAPMQLLFVMSAETGNIAKSDQGYTLTLNDVDPHVLWFSDRPNRKAGFVPLTQFLNSWSKGFAGDPPNAGLVHVGMEAKVNGQNQPMAMELSKPSYTNGKLRFQVTDLKGDIVSVGTVRNVKLFFDGAWGPDPQFVPVKPGEYEPVGRNWACAGPSCIDH